MSTANSVPAHPCKTPEARLGTLMEIASKIDFIHGLNIQQYFRVMRSMISAIDMYVKTNQKEAAYVLASKFAILYLQHLPNHREYTLINSAEKIEWNARCKSILGRAEKLKAELQSRYELEYAEYLEAQHAKQLEESVKQAEEAERKKASELARIQQEKRATIIGALVPKAPSTQFFDKNSSLRLPSYPSVMENNDGSVEHRVRISALVPPAIDRSLKPPSVKTNAYGWSTVRISMQMTYRFLQMAAVNTRGNTETCGNLCGRVVGDEFHITDLLLLKQSGTSDSCTTYKEEELFEYTEKRGLLVLGWIHTHPSQTAFLSSVDQHSQLSYQIMLPEAIAIVCAPKFNDVQIFSLTPTHGIQYVRQCKQVGFHPHDETTPIYEPSQHVVDDPKLAFSVLDLR